MVNVAVAGGSSATLGKSIVEAIAATKGRHSVIILGRASASTSHEAQQYGVPVVPVDYSSVESVKQALEKNSIHTLISVLKANDPKSVVSTHANLLEAAKATRVARFIMSDWSMSPTAHRTVDLLGHKADLNTLGHQHMHLAKSNREHAVECCTIQCGIYMEYFVQGSPNPALSRGLKDDLLQDYINLADRKLIVPCGPDGTAARITTTSIRDIGTYIAAALDLPPSKLTGQIGLAGSTLTFDEIPPALATLDPPLVLHVTHVSKAQLDAIAKEQEQIFQAKWKHGTVDTSALRHDMAAQIFSAACDGGGVVQPQLNELCPDVVPMKLETMLAQAWAA